MLTRDEELRLAAVFDITRHHIHEYGPHADAPMSNQALLWLAEKLKETNDDLKDLKDKHNQLDVMLAQCLTEREQYKLELDQLKGNA